MKTRNKIAGIFAVICMLFNTVVVNAQQHEINYIKSLNDEYMKISGTVTNGANKDLFVRIDYTATAPSSDTESLENSVLYQKQGKTDANGYFEFNVKLNEIGNNSYTLRLGVLGDDNDIHETFVFYGDSYRNTALGAIQAAQRNQDADALATAIITYYPNLYLQTPVFDAYYSVDTDLSEIKSILINYPLITTVSALEESLEGVVIVRDLKQSTGCEDMQRVFGIYDSKLDILNSTIYRLTYSNLSPEMKTTAYHTLKAKPFYTPSEIKDVFTLSVLNTYLANAVGAGSVKTVLSDNEALFGITMTDYNLSDAKFMELIGYEFSAVSDIKTKLDNLKNVPLPTPTPTPGAFVDGGGGGGGVAAPIVDQNKVTDSATNTNYPFRDMDDYAWAKEATLALYQSGVVNGVGDDNFAPQRAVTREEFLKLIVSGFGITASMDNDISFGDVYKSQWYYPFVKAGVNSGIINGMDDNTFGIGQQISRQDMVVMLYRAISMKKDLSKLHTNSTFEDYDLISDYAKDAVAFAEANAIVNGLGDGKFHPQDSANRAEAVVILHRAIEYLSNNM